MMSPDQQGRRPGVVVAGIVCVVMASSLAGCGGKGEFADLKAQLDEIRQRPRGAIQPPPEFKAQPTFTYAAHKLRSPFLPPVDEAVVPDMETKAVAPDLTRPKEYLEGYNIEGLKMKGTMQRPGNVLVAIIQDTDGQTHMVRPGNYLGKNFGRVVMVEEGKVSVMEVVPDGHDGWVERPRMIRLEGE